MWTHDLCLVIEIAMATSVWLAQCFLKVQSGARVKQTKSTTNQPATSACADANGDFADFKTFDDAGDDFNPRALEAGIVTFQLMV